MYKKLYNFLSNKDLYISYKEKIKSLFEFETELPSLTESELNTSSRTPVYFGLALVFVLFIIGGGWLYFANLSSAVIAQGNVAVAGKPKTVQHLDGGIILKINVADGDEVNKDDVLISLDPTLLNANLEIYRNRLREAVASRARLLAERDGLENIKWENEILDILNIKPDDAIRLGHKKLFEARRTSRLGLISQLNEQVSQLENQIKGVKSLQQSKNKQINILSEELEKVQGLRTQGLITNTQVMSLESQKENLQGQLGEHISDLARIGNSINETKIQILQIEREFRQSVLAELREIEQVVNDTVQQLRTTSDQLKRVNIRAPVSGIIHELSVFTIGGVIGAGDSILQIIPQDNELVIEANVEPQFIDELYPSQEAAVRFSSFNQTTTPEIIAIVENISANIVVDPITGFPFYKVRLSVSEAELARLGGQKLIVGMPVEAFIKTRERTALNYLLKPLTDQINRAFREE